MQRRKHRGLERLAEAVTGWTGGNGGFATAAATVIVWALLGPVFKFSDTWQLVINTGTTIVTFLMVFLIQNTQNRETAAMQVKLDEIIYAIRGAQNRMIGIEHLTDKELEALVAEAERRAATPAAQRTDKLFQKAAPARKSRSKAKSPSRPGPRKPAASRNK